MKATKTRVLVPILSSPRDSG